MGLAPAMGAELTLDTHLDNIPAYAQHRAPSHATEKILMDSLAAIRENRLDTALHDIETLIETHPEFRLAQLIYGDLLLSKGQSITNVGSRSNAPQDKVFGLREEARQRVKHHLRRPDPDTLPGYLIQPGKNVTHLVVVDISESRLYLFENHDEKRADKIHLRGDYYASVGKNGFPKQSEGDQKTPIGIYMTVDSIPAEDLPDRYGAGAFPVNYPNKWDNRLDRTGHGIWIHGVPSNTYSRPPHSSDGCIAIANEDLRLIKDVLAVPNIPVIIAEQIPWFERREIAARRNEFQAQFDRWRLDWESRDNTRYARHYSRDFRNETGNRASWLEHKRRVNAGKQYIQVGISTLRVLGYPGEPDTVEATFHQDYRSSNYDSRSGKRQYWRKEKDDDGDGSGKKSEVWRIVYEGAL
ncbi:MAG: L,D-transpeptidase family protein [Gammaproteobacteria bacterium]|nr:L,D-transpeptidase family protein [Gammaproteobacteria bacterium]